MEGRSWKETDLAFPAVGRLETYLGRHNVRRIIRRVLCRAGLGEETVEEGRNPKRPQRKFSPRFRLYDLRHSNTWLLLAAGVDVKTVSERLGHTDPGFTLRTYVHGLEESERNAATKLDDFVSNGT